MADILANNLEKPCRLIFWMRTSGIWMMRMFFSGNCLLGGWPQVFFKPDVLRFNASSLTGIFFFVVRKCLEFVQRNGRK